jgi:hypothetical protein
MPLLHEFRNSSADGSQSGGANLPIAMISYENWRTACGQSPFKRSLLGQKSGGRAID